MFLDPEKPDGLSIAKLAAKLGITKNTAIGVLDRAGLIGLTNPKPVHRVIRFPELHHCVYMYGATDDPRFHFCGNPVDRGTYCPVHDAMVHIKGSNPVVTKIPKWMTAA
jgi:hypothetical protein